MVTKDQVIEMLPATEQLLRQMRIGHVRNHEQGHEDRAEHGPGVDEPGHPAGPLRSLPRRAENGPGGAIQTLNWLTVGLDSWGAPALDVWLDGLALR